MNHITKVCGMTEANNIRNIEQLGVDMIGFIFYPQSPRCLHKMPEYLPINAKRVGVFVNESEENILSYTTRFGLDYIQLYGNESPVFCHSLQSNGLHLIKAFSISHPNDLSGTSAYDGLCDYYLFDTKCPQHGGSGHQFDWSLLHCYDGSTTFLLSGGINPQSAEDISKFHHPRFAGIDINSRFETSPGIKNILHIDKFLKELKSLTS